MRDTIVFVYNADSGVFNTLTDIAHKVFAPETYSCSLCAITYGTFGMRSEWQHFLESLDSDLEFLHRDELAERYAVTDIALPAVFIRRSGVLTLWITAQEIGSCSTIAELKQLIAEKPGLNDPDTLHSAA